MKNERILANAEDATSDFESDSINLTAFNGIWSVTIVRSESDGNPTASIECSNDDTNWFAYKEESTNISVVNGEIFIDDEFIPKYLRVAYFAGGGTGTVTIKLFKDPDLV